ncbi:hypothetical protein PRNP1_005076 [Phytophthora ramorum]
MADRTSSCAQDGPKRLKTSSGPAPRRYPVPGHGSPSLPGISAMLKQQASPDRDAFMLSPRSPATELQLSRPTPSEDDPDQLKLYQETGYQETDLQARKAAAAAVAKALAPTTTTSTVTPTLNLTSATTAKSSRYLREMDRRAILSRIAQGEKQSALAKEYQVSRAAICNLNKHRDEVLSRKDGNPLAKHPKKPRPKSMKLKLGKSGWTEAMALRDSLTQQQNGVHEIKSRAAALLLTTLRKRHATVNEFRRSGDRLMRLVMEEALAHVPVKTVEIFLPNHSKSDGVALEHPPCAISMEPAGCPMLELFHLMEPDQPTGYVTFGDVSCSPPADVHVKLFDARMPGSLNYHNVFLVDHVVTSPDLVSAVVRRLQERGAVEAMISLVALMATAEAVEKIHAAFPALKVVVAQVDNGSDELAASCDADPTRVRASTTDMILDRLEQVYHGFSPAKAY